MTNSLATSSFNGFVLSSKNEGWPTVTQEQIILSPRLLEDTPYTHGMLIKKEGSHIYYVPQEFHSIRGLIRKLAVFEMVKNETLVDKASVLYHFDANNLNKLSFAGEAVMFNMRTGLTRFVDEISHSEVAKQAHEKHNLVITWVPAAQLPEIKTQNRMLS